MLRRPLKGRKKKTHLGIFYLHGFELSRGFSGENTLLISECITKENIMRKSACRISKHVI